MQLRPPVIWIILSVATYVVGYAWRALDSESTLATYLKFAGWISFILAVGFVSKPANSRIGKLFMASVIVMTIGICWKVLHLFFAKEIIIVGLAGMVITYASTFVKKA